jgi:disulfide bond formation protein DsbB
LFDLQTMKLFFAILALGANVAVVGYLLTAIAGTWSPTAVALKDRIHEMLDGYELFFAAIVAGIAMLGSLYLSEVAHLIPCTDCWYQRIAMYPTAVILGIAAYRRDAAIRVYVVPIATIGGIISTYHYLIQWFPGLEGAACSSVVPCTAPWFRVFGFVSIPYMALSGFTLVLLLMWVLRANDGGTSDVELAGS